MKINILYWLLLPLALFLSYKLIIGFNATSQSFYGFTENKQTEINLDFSAIVKKVYVVAGQKVKKGDILVELDKPSLNKDILQLSQNIEEIKSKMSINSAEAQASIEKVMADTKFKAAQIKTEIETEEAKLAFNKSLLANGATKNSENNHPIEQKIASLKTELATLESNSRNLIDSYKKIIRDNSKFSQVALNQNLQLKDFIILEKNKLKIVAPRDGLIGNINCRESEFVESYKSLISFYEPSANNVVGYIHESQMLKLKVGDKLQIKSLLQPKNSYTGIITGKGHRLVEIPERLRKIPEYKTYGMEVFIKIDEANDFLQKEVVILSMIEN